MNQLNTNATNPLNILKNSFLQMSQYGAQMITTCRGDIKSTTYLSWMDLLNYLQKHQCSL